MIKRILGVVLATMFLASSNSVEAQQPGKVARIGYLDNSTAAGSAELFEHFRKQMTQFNLIEGKNLAIEYRYAEGKLDRLSELADDLVSLRVNIILVSSTNTALVVKKVTNTIPIVMVNSTDPVTLGLVTSLAYPGGNITGLATFSEDLPGKGSKS